MTYKEIINRFRQAVEDHKMLKSFGYGELSDLKSQAQLSIEEDGVDYPYMFLLPGANTRNGSVMQYQFNMVMMDMARGEEGDEYDNYITIQSQCQQYIDDILAHLYYYYKDQPDIQLTGITYTPFKEKYQDQLAGMTATISIQVPTPINECVAPYTTLTLVDTISVNAATNRPYNFGNVTDQWPIPEEFNYYKLVWSIDIEQNVDLSDDPSPWSNPYFTIYVEVDGSEMPYYAVEQAWTSQVGGVITLQGETYVGLQDVPPDSRDLFFGFGYLGSTYPDGSPTTPVPNAIDVLGGQIEIYRVD